MYLRDIIKEEDQYTPVTLLEYLKHPHLVEWDNLVKDIKVLAEEADMFNGQNPFGGSDEKSGSANTADDLPFSFLLYWIQSRVLHLSSHYVLVSGLLFVRILFTELYLVW